VILAQTVREFFAGRRLDPQPVLVAVSGGPDSTALLLAFAELRPEGFEVSAGHVNHALRGTDSAADEQFVRELCASRGIGLQVCSGELPDEQVRSVGIEAAAREVRYDALRRMAAMTGAKWIATAHTQDDQAETVLMRLLTGSGLRKLQGIRPLTPEGVIRPLLRASRAEVEQFLAERGVSPRHDHSNSDTRFLRNRIRSELMPLLRDINPSISSALARTAEQAQEAAEALEPLLREQESGWVLEAEENAVFDLSAAPGSEWLFRTALMRQIRRLDREEREISAADLERISRSISGLTRLTISPRLELERSGFLLTLRRAQQKRRR
jgi:tRNA(Ile)-lysidine synthase